jgi:mono/diheme cytochrome c family protein
MRQFYFFTKLIAIIIVIFFVTSCHNSSGNKTGTQTATDSVSAMVARGDYLVNTVCNCMHCHADRDFKKFAGPLIPGTDGKGGEQIDPGIYVRNITPTVLGSWTDDQVAHVLTTGITKDGDTLFPTMPYRNFKKMSKYDIYSIVAYLRTLKPIPDNVPKRTMDSFPHGFLRAVYDSFYVKHENDTLPVPSPGDRVAMGAYLVNAADCMGCHSPVDYKKLDFNKDKWFSGGIPFDLTSEYGFKVTSANLTPDSATGIGAWSEEMFLNKFKNYRDSSGFNFNPGKYNTLMPWTVLAKMHDEDIRDIYAYLRTIKPVKDSVTKWPQ